MRRSEKESVSVWHAQEAAFLSSPLDRDIDVDVCVIGAGIAGLTTALMLQKEGKKVAIAEAWSIGAGETGRTTAHLTAALDDHFYRLEEIFGAEKSRLAADSHKAAIDLIERLVREHSIDCDFERLDGYLTALTEEQRENLVKESEACKRAGLHHEYLMRMSVPDISVGPVLKYPQQATFNITKYMAGLSKAFQKLGGEIYTGTRISHVEGGTNPYAETADGHRIKAGIIVMATNTPVNDWVRMHTKQAAYRTYVLAFQVPKDSYQPFLLWDMAEPYHYARIVRGDKQDYLVVGGEDHKTGQANDADARYQRIENWTKKHFSVVGPEAFRWSGQIMEPVDYLAFIGRNPLDKNVYIVTGDSGNGITHSTIAGMLIPDLIQGRENAWSEIYDPSRKTLQTAQNYVKENANFVGCMISDWAEPAEVAKAEDIPLNQGAIMRHGLSKAAVFKDADGSLHECSAVCTHLGCVVQWNGGEKSWDCPCHGSRFDTEGDILNGPAIKPLKRLEHEDHVGMSREKEEERRGDTRL